VNNPDISYYISVCIRYKDGDLSRRKIVDIEFGADQFDKIVQLRDHLLSLEYHYATYGTFTSHDAFISADETDLDDFLDGYYKCEIQKQDYYKIFKRTVEEVSERAIKIYKTGITQ
jgi:hypothetical protein